MMLNRHNKNSAQTEVVVAQIRKRAQSLYLNRQMLCSEAVLVTLNQGLNGGLSDSQAMAMAAPFSIAMGESGCLCGALSGAVMACGLFIGSDHPYQRRATRACGRQLHDSFKAVNGATCCKVLSCKVKHDRNAHFQQCAGLTAGAAEMAARMILNKRPELVPGADKGLLIRRDSKMNIAMTRLFQLFQTIPLALKQLLIRYC
ncbi:MAG: C-GCAxxG-C-C family protein [Desulfobacterales bacterium]|nr:C-GCAxxG-C-C family protein [Desulfobacterales bacterium]